MKNVLIAAAMMVAFAVSLGAQAQTRSTGPTQSLGELARKLKAERKTQGSKPARVFTNDNIPRRRGMILKGAEEPTPRGEKRSTAAKDEFKRGHPCPATGNREGPCPGYVIDHITPLACGGADAPSNMQWQSVGEGRGKDKWERKECSK